MPHPQRSPFVMLAFPRFQGDFGDLINSDSLITDFARALIDGIFESIMWFGRTDRDYRQFERTARAAYHFLKEGTKAKPREIAQQYFLITDRIIPALNSSGLALNEARKVSSGDPDNRIRKYLEAYKVMCEGLLCVVLAPVIYAFGVAKRVKEKDFIPDESGKIRLSALKTVEKLIVYSDNRLAIGLDNHVRNAYSHENYKILDDARVELWDPNPYKPKKHGVPRYGHWRN